MRCPGSVLLCCVELEENTCWGEKPLAPGDSLGELGGGGRCLTNDRGRGWGLYVNLAPPSKAHSRQAALTCSFVQCPQRLLQGERRQGRAWQGVGFIRDFPRRSVVKTLRFHCRKRGFDPWSGN